MKTFEELIKLGRTEPTIHGYMMLLKNGDMTKEEALIGMVWTLAEKKKRPTSISNIWNDALRLGFRHDRGIEALTTKVIA